MQIVQDAGDLLRGTGALHRDPAAVGQDRAGGRAGDEVDVLFTDRGHAVDLRVGVHRDRPAPVEAHLDVDTITGEPDSGDLS